jgi:DNA-binding SARP family transcriptional activator
MEFRILGALEVDDDSGPVTVRGTRRRALLCRLLLRANQPVAVDRLVHDIWSGAPPPGAASTLASHVSLLRKALGPGRLEHRPGGYRLCVGDGELDADRFQADVEIGRRSLRQAHPQRAVDHFVRALGLWRGGALADVEDAPWARGEIARLEELRLGTEEALLSARLDLGLHREVTADAEAAVGDHPLREQRWSTLMLALYRSGRQADALRAFQRLRALLDEQLGVEPSPEVADLEQAIVLQSPELRWSPAPAGRTEVVAPGPRSSVVTTVLVARVVPGEAGEPGVEHPSELSDLVVRHGGHLDATNAGMLASFDSPTAALEAACALQVAADVREASDERREGARSGPEAWPGSSSRLGIGVSIGEVTVSGGAPVGDPVREALALCDRAGPGEVLVSAPVCTMAGRPSRFGVSGRGTLGVVPHADPVDVLALEWRQPRHEATENPTSQGPGGGGGVFTFVGRADEQDRLMRLYAAATQGQRQLVLLGGEPGIGKSSLADAVARQVHAAGGAVLYGRCLEVSSAPYQPFVEALDHCVRHAPDEFLASHVAQHGGELCRLVPTLDRRVPTAGPPTTSDADTERYLTLTAATGLLGHIATVRPLLLVLEDLQWADVASVQLLGHLMSHSHGMRIFILATFRSNEITPDHPLGQIFAALWREGNVNRMELEGLAPADVEDLCVSYAGELIERGDVAGFAEELRVETAGNPFFVCELLRSMAESGDVVRRTGEGRPAEHPLMGTALPTSLREVIGQRVHRLGTKTERVLVLAAVIGVEFNLTTLASLAEMDPEPLLDLLERAERASILESREDDVFVFAHALIRRTLYVGLQPARRSRLHARVAWAMEQGSVPTPASAVIAHHFLAAGEQEAALRWTERAGRDALASVAPDDAVGWFGQACALAERLHPDERVRLCDLTLQHGVSLLLAGRPSHREVLLRAAATAKSAGDGRRMAWAALANTRGYPSAGQIDQDRLDVLLGALALLGEGEDLLRARLTASLCSESTFGTPLDDRRSLAHLAKSSARALGDPRTIVEVNNLVVEALRYPTELAERLEDTAVALDLAERLHDPAALFWAINHRMQTLVEAGRVVEAEAHLERMAGLSEEVGQPVMRWMTAFTRAQWALLHGETATGEHLAEEAYGFGESIGQPDALNCYATQLSHVRWQQGRLHELVDTMADGAEQNPGIPAYRGALCRALGQAGRTEEARALLDQAVASRFSDLPKDLLWTYGMVTFAEVAVHLEHVDAAAALYDQMAPFHDQVSFVGTTCEGAIAHYLGGLATVLGRFGPAREHLEAASRFAALARSPYFRARTSIESGRLAARSGDLDGARRSLTEGRELAEGGQFWAETRRADEALAGLG